MQISMNVPPWSYNVPLSSSNSLRWKTILILRRLTSDVSDWCLSFPTSFWRATSQWSSSLSGWETQKGSESKQHKGIESKNWSNHYRAQSCNKSESSVCECGNHTRTIDRQYVSIVKAHFVLGLHPSTFFRSKSNRTLASNKSRYVVQYFLTFNFSLQFVANDLTAATLLWWLAHEWSILRRDSWFVTQASKQSVSEAGQDDCIHHPGTLIIDRVWVFKVLFDFIPGVWGVETCSIHFLR